MIKDIEISCWILIQTFLIFVCCLLFSMNGEMQLLKMNLIVEHSISFMITIVAIHVITRKGKERKLSNIDLLASMQMVPKENR